MIGAVWRWWTGELAGLASDLAPWRAPAAWRAEPRGDGLVLIRRRTFGRRTASPLVLAADGRPLPGVRRLDLVVPASHALRRQVVLPAAAAGHLPQVLRFEIGRQTPFTADQAVWTGRVVGRDAAAQTITVALTVVPRDRLRPLLDRLAAAGLTVAAVGVAREAGAPAWLPAAAWRGDASAAVADRRLRRGLVAAATLLAGLALLSPLISLERQIADQDRRIAALRPVLGTDPAEGTAAQRLARTVAERYGRLPSLTLLLERLSLRVPDDAWLTGLAVGDGKLDLYGFAAAAAGLVPTLEAAPFLAHARFVGPVLPDPATRAERYHLAMDVTGGPP